MMKSSYALSNADVCFDISKSLCDIASKFICVFTDLVNDTVASEIALIANDVLPPIACSLEVEQIIIAYEDVIINEEVESACDEDSLCEETLELNVMFHSIPLSAEECEAKAEPHYVKRTISHGNCGGTVGAVELLRTTLLYRRTFAMVIDVP